LKNESDIVDEQVKKSFEKALNRQGYGFQYSVLKKAKDILGQGSQWYLETSEFPVVQGPGTRIDFILRHRYHTNLYLLAECKRANPAYSDWCFAKAPFIHRKRSSDYEELMMECIEYEGGTRFRSYAKKFFYLSNAYHVALEIKSQKKGNPCGETGKTIEDAATQICRGLNGMIEFFSRNPKYLGNDTPAILLPVVFTTAQVWGSNIDLSMANLETGELRLEDSKFTKEPWIAYQYHQSPSLKHSLSSKDVLKTLGEFMDIEYVRTIPIVSSSGIETFLRWSSERTYL
jgi:hypothetical protein